MKLKVTVNPNPFRSELFIFIQSDVSVNTVLKLTDIKKSLVRMVGCTLQKGENKVHIKNLSRYVVGSYQLELKLLNGDLLQSVALIKE